MNASKVNKGLLLFLCTLTTFTILTSYYRYVVATDFLVSYEIDCDPTVANCYIGCEDDDCSEEYYYQEIERHASTLLNLCGYDISDCDAAYTCMIGEDDCSLFSCDPTEEANECAVPNK